MDNKIFNNTEIDLTGAANQMVQEWAVIVMSRWFEALQYYGIGKTRALQWSFQKQLIKANGDVEAVIFKFLQYGRFIDMGVGRGQDLNGLVLARKYDRYRDVNGKMTWGLVSRIARKKKPWYTKTFYREVAKLADLYKAKYGEKIVSVLENQFTGTLNLNM